MASASVSTIVRAFASAAEGSASRRAAASTRERVRASGAAAISPASAAKALGRARERAQRVQADHVGAALPDAVERRLAIQARERRLLDVAVAAEAFHRLDRDRGHALAEPVLGDRGERALQLALARVGRARRRMRRRGATRAAAPPPPRARGRRARWPSAACSARCLPKALRWRRVVQRLVQRRAHHARDAHHDVEARVVRHLDQRGDAASRLAHGPGDGVAVFDLGGGVRAVAAPCP